MQPFGCLSSLVAALSMFFSKALDVPKKRKQRGQLQFKLDLSSLLPPNSLMNSAFGKQYRLCVIYGVTLQPATLKSDQPIFEFELAPATLNTWFSHRIRSAR